MENNVDHTCHSQNIIAAGINATMDKGIIDVEQQLCPRPPDHQDVGYASENSAHLSNEEGAGEFVRVYTYTSVKSTTPHVLEVVMDGECRPRRTPKRDIEKDSELRDTMKMADGSPNCATFYFKHQDSDTDCCAYDTKMFLNFEQKTCKVSDCCLDTSGMENDDDEEADNGPKRVLCPDQIHKLVSEVDHLVNRPCLEKDFTHLTPTHSVDSSCDASGECTSSNDSDAESLPSSSSSASLSSQDQKGSVIHLKMVTSTPIAIPAVVADKNISASEPGNANGVVRMRMKKRRNGDRPWSVVELNNSSNDQLNLSHFSNSETALHHLSRRGLLAKDSSSAAKEGESSTGQRQLKKSTSRRRNSKQVDSNSEDKCHSMGSLRHSSSSENGHRKSVPSLHMSRTHHQSDWDDSEAMEGHHCNVSIDSINASTTLLMNSESCYAPTADELSSHSEQAWDDYQDPLYMSEPYSEPGVDDEIVQRIWDFGDDYRAFIESHSDGMSTPSFPCKIKTRQRQALTKASSNSRESSVLDSESDFDDLNEVIEQHHKQLRLTELQLKAEIGHDPSEPGRHTKISEVLATCQIHLQCLRKVWKQLIEVKLKPLDLNLGIQQAGEQLELRWERLLLEANDHEMRLAELSQLQNEVSVFDLKLKEMLDKAASVSELVIDWNSVAPVEQALKNCAGCLSKIKQDLANLNFTIHNYITRTGLDVCHLKEEVVVLYRLWNQAQDFVHEKLLWVHRLDAAWREYSECQDRLKVIMDEDEHMLLMLAAGLKNSPDFLASALPVIPELSNVAELKEKLCNIVDMDYYQALKSSGDAHTCMTDFNRSSDELKSLLGKGSAAEEVEINSRKMAENVTEQQEKCRQLLGEMAEVLKLRSEPKMGFRNCTGDNSVKYERKGRLASSSSSSASPTLLWRVIRAALPIQLVVVILFCFACFFEPHCCDSVNNLNLSLTPQLRYVRGPPPI